jgi:hypothetical protein
MENITPRICDDCGTEVTGKYRRRRCEACYRRVLRREKGMLSRTKTLPENIWQSQRPELYEKVFGNTTPGPDGCIIYTGHTGTRGYRRIYVGGGRHSGVHRVAYELLVGPIPGGMTVDHVCHNRSATCPGGASCVHRRCVNPRHLEAVTAEENTRRAAVRPTSRMGWKGAPRGSRKRRDFCQKGHEMTPENTVWEKRPATPDGRIPQCRQCRRNYQAAYQERKRQGASIP